MKKIILLLLILCVLCSNLCAETVRSITVTGKSSSFAIANYATISFKLESITKDMGKSYKEVTNIYSNIVEKFNKIGIVKEDFKKSFITQRKQHEWRKQVKVFVGYISNCHVEVKIKDINNLNKVYSILSQEKNAQVNQTMFGHSEKHNLQNKELEKALLIAKEKAKTLAKSSNETLGKVISIEESSNVSSIRPPFRRNKMALSAESMGSGGNEDINFQGKIKVTADVLVKYKIKG